MERATIYLKTALFSVGGPDAHVPVGVMILEGEIADRPPGGVTVRADRLLDANGRELAEQSLAVFLPWGKVDHMVLNGA